MLTIQDCIELSELTEEEILAIAQHEHIPEMAAVELGNYLVNTPDGEKVIKAMIVDDIDASEARWRCGARGHAQALPQALLGAPQRHRRVRALKHAGCLRCSIRR